MSVDLRFVDETVERIGRTPDAVIPLLQAMQDHYGYLPEEVLRRVCAATQITPAAIGGVSTFYDMFRHAPSGEHIVHVCHGTACHVGGAERIEEALRRHGRHHPCHRKPHVKILCDFRAASSGVPRNRQGGEYNRV